MRAAISSSVRDNINPWVAYCDTSSRICGASGRSARRTIAVDADDLALERLRGDPEASGKLCTRNVYIRTPRLARVSASPAPQAIRSVTREDSGLAVLVEGENLVVLLARPLHSRRSHRHTRHCQPRHPGLFLQQLRDIRGGHVSLDQIPVHHCGVTRRQGVGDAEGALYFRHCRSVLRVDTVAVLDEIVDPVLAAAAARILVDGDPRLLRMRIDRRRSRAGGERQREQRRAKRKNLSQIFFHSGIALSVRSICRL